MNSKPQPSQVNILEFSIFWVKNIHVLAGQFMLVHQVLRRFGISKNRMRLGSHWTSTAIKPALPFQLGTCAIWDTNTCITFH